MAIKREVKEIEIPAAKKQFVIETATCDKCGVELILDYDDVEDADDELRYRQEVEVQLNPNECVHSYIRLDLCMGCVDPIWRGICNTLNVDPDDEHRIGYK